jgi:transposase
MQWTVAVGVDTHKNVHVAVALDALGVELGSREIVATAAGYRSLLCWARELGMPAFAVEGTGSYGAGLVRFLERAGVSVYECERQAVSPRYMSRTDKRVSARGADSRRLGADMRLTFCNARQGAPPGG